MEIFGIDVTIVIAALNGIALTVLAFLKEYEKIAAKITLRIEKDSADGHWSNEEKERLAVELYEQDIYPKFPVYLKLLSRIVGGKKIVKKLIRKLCAKSKELKK